jgi:hypothetical protein
MWFLFKQIIPFAFHIAFGAGRASFSLPSFGKLELVTKITFVLIFHGFAGSTEALVVGTGVVMATIETAVQVDSARRAGFFPTRLGARQGFVNRLAGMAILHELPPKTFCPEGKLT